jgi:hypothetical protein
MVAEVIHQNDLFDQVFRTAVQHTESNKNCLHSVSMFLTFVIRVSLCSFKLRTAKKTSVRRAGSMTDT